MNIYDYVLEKLAENKRLTDPLVVRYGDAEKILNLSNDEIAKILFSTQIHEESIKKFLENKSEFNSNPKEFISRYNLEVERIRKTFGVEIISFSDKEYPPQLKKIKEIPLSLYVKGKLNFNYEKSVSIVGTRKLTIYAKKKVREMTSELVKKGFCIISGLARGIDTEAHTSTILAGGKTIAVLPYINEIYPPENEPLSKEIIDSGGAIVSENCFFSRQYNRSLFPQRNRMISGLSKGVFIVEGSRISGSLSQYNHAKRQGKIIFSLKPIYKHEGDYLPRLIMGQQGNWVTSSEDIIRLLGEKRRNQKSLYYL
ncbi:DNA-protecting protein DprA [Candidatus Pacearchaeota archaeon]|nr:DNA-protecting protein DprA [Candidatus Pacearchaeota archaeon]